MDYDYIADEAGRLYVVTVMDHQNNCHLHLRVKALSSTQARDVYATEPTFTILSVR